MENAIANKLNIIDGPKTARYGVTLTLTKDILNIDVDGANSPGEVNSVVVAFVFENKSDKELGAYFLKGELDDTGIATTNNIATNLSLVGTPDDGSDNISDFATATFGDYTRIPASSSSYLTMSVQLDKLVEKPVTINLDNQDIKLNIETYNEKLVETVEVATNSALISEIATASETGDFVRLELTEDIDVIDLLTSAASESSASALSAVTLTEEPINMTAEELFNTYGYFIEEFYGEIDGGGHTLTLTTKDLRASAGITSPRSYFLVWW